MFHYFLRDKKFFQHLIIKAQISVPSFNKGLLINGGYGVGKIANIKALEQCFFYHPAHRFKVFSTNALVQEFENCETTSDKNAFYYKMNLGVNIYDGITTERLASNYGHVNFLKEVLEERCMRKKLTHSTANYKEGGEKTAEAALAYIGESYESRVYDRLSKMFNVVIFEDKSLRR